MGRRNVAAMRIHGKVSSGLGRAHIFMAQSHYQEQFKRILGKTAWPGTLNLKVSGDDFVNNIALRNLVGIEIKDADEELKAAAEHVEVSSLDPVRVNGFLRDGVSFGGATAFLAEILTPEIVPCAVLIPDLTRHVDVVEIISEVFLREELDVVDGDDVLVIINS